MTVAGWILLGAVVGVMAHGMSRSRLPGGPLGTVGAGSAGAFLGGGIYSLVARTDVGSFDVLSLLPALLGAVALLAATYKADFAGPF